MRPGPAIAGTAAGGSAQPVASCFPLCSWPCCRSPRCAPGGERAKEAITGRRPSTAARPVVPATERRSTSHVPVGTPETQAGQLHRIRGDSSGRRWAGAAGPHLPTVVRPEGGERQPQTRSDTCAGPAACDAGCSPGWGAGRRVCGRGDLPSCGKPVKSTPSPSTPTGGPWRRR